MGDEISSAKGFRLGREAAINVLPEEFVGNPKRIAHLQCEAKMLPLLNHPNIAAAQHECVLEWGS